MPPVLIIAAISSGIGWAGGVTMFGFTEAQTALLSFVANIALGFVANALSPKPKIPNLGSFETQARDRLQQFRQPITPWRTIYGEVRVSGPMTFLDTTNDNSFLHMVLTLASHEVEAIETIFFGDEAIPAEALDADGNVTSGTYSGKARIQKDLGAGTGQPFPDLASATTNWTSTHKQTGRAKIYIRMEYDKDVYPSQVPNVSAWVKGKKIADPRNSSTVAWSPNPALCVRDYLVTSTVDAGGGATTLEVNDVFTNAAANTAEEIVSTSRIVASVVSVDASADVLTLQGSTAQFFTGDRIVVSTTGGAIPTGLVAGTPYYVIPTQRHTAVKTKLATSYANAIANTPVALSDAGSGTIHMIKTGEPRFTLNGMIEADEQPSKIIGNMLTAMGGRAVYASGQWRVIAAAWPQPSLILDENDIIAPVQVQTKQSRRDRFNAVKGVYVSVLNLDQPSDYPPITNSTYETEDGGERMIRELDLPFTNRPHTAMRLAKIELERHRQQITATTILSLRALQVQAGDTVQITNSRFGWSTKAFEVVEWKLTVIGTPPILGCEVKLRESASDVFDWNSGLETVVDPAPNTNSPDILDVNAPENFDVTEELYDTRGSAGVKAKATLTWNAPSGAFIDKYFIDRQKTQDSDGNAVTEDYTPIAETAGTLHEVYDIAPGIYNFRVKAQSFWGVSSDWTLRLNHEIVGLLAAPTEPQNLTISAIGGIALLRWDATPDLDVKVGGTYVFRHDAATSGGAWNTSVGIGAAIPGSETTALLPLKEGTYLVKAVDSSGVESATAATITTKQATVQIYSPASTITESTAFTGSTTNIKAGGGVITLVGSGLVDTIPDIDSVADWDSYGGVAATGTYVFGAAFDFGSVVSRRYTTDIESIITNVNDLIDSRETNIDLWEDFDGDVSGAADARVYAAETDDDPTGSPTWSSWNLIESAEYTARAVKFQCVLTTSDPAFNIAVSKLEVVAASAA